MVRVKGEDALRIWLYFKSGTSYREREFVEILEKYNLSVEDAKKVAEKFEKEVFGE
jgi:heme oxygenase